VDPSGAAALGLAERQTADTVRVVATAPASPRVRLRRGARKGRYDEAAVASVLARGLVAHVAFLDGDQPFCLPMLYAHVGNDLYVHGSRASRAVRRLSVGVPACATVTVIDGFVLARSVFEHSANYASVIALGRFAPVEGEAASLAALEAFTEKLLPGRWHEVRPPSSGELKATAILSLTLDEASVKLRSGPPDDCRSADAMLPVWAGVVPIESHFGDPMPAPGLAPETALSPSVERLLQEQRLNDASRRGPVRGR
jgi:nitroimidazol reductase NimA-like FMN-containing flavoprotein (pyridoxamine 5'-phosphate oxidase superfamily)